MDPRNFWLVQSPASVKLEMGVACEGRYLLRLGTGPGGYRPPCHMAPNNSASA